MNTLSLQDQYWSCSEEERLSNNRDHFYFSWSPAKQGKGFIQERGKT
jgi:hypothetical protein